MKTIYFDEAGNTGPDLLNSDQPVFVLCSTDLNDEEAKELLSQYFDLSNEIHFKKLKQPKKNQEAIIDFITSQKEVLSSHCKVSLYHKEYMVTCKMLDYLVEPQLAEDGIDYYDEGMNIAHANMFFFCIKGFCGEVLAKDVYVKYLNMMREQTKDSIEEFRKAIKKAEDNCLDEQFKGEFFVLNRALTDANSLFTFVSKADFDPALSALIDLIQRWMEDSAEGLKIVHDDSVTIDSRKEDIEFLTKMQSETTRVGYGKFTAQFPLNIKQFEFSRSEKSYSIQICDLISSSICYVNKESNKNKTEFYKNLIDIYKDFPIANSVWPSTNVEPMKDKKKQIGNINPVDFLAYQMQKYSAEKQMY